MKYSHTEHFKYKLEERFIVKTAIIGYSFRTPYISMFPDGRLSIHKGYAWDGSSVPFKKTFRIISLGLYDADKHCKEASLVHDALCQAMREGPVRSSWKLTADTLYRYMLIEYRLRRWATDAHAKLEAKLLKPNLKPKARAKLKAKYYKKLIKQRKKAEQWADRRYWALREFGDSGIKPEKNPRNKIYDTKSLKGR